jgi:hypothetical protein
VVCSEVKVTAAEHRTDATVGAVRVASKGRGLNIKECLQPRNERRTEAAVRVLWEPTLS